MMLAVQSPGYFLPVEECGLLLAADVVVVADTFQFSRKSARHRAAIKSAAGARWLTVPVSGGAAAARLCDLAIDNSQPWPEEHWRAMEYNYHNAAYFPYYAGEIERLLASGAVKLAELLELTFEMVWRGLHAGARTVLASQLEPLADRSDRVIAWARACGADRYLLRPVELELLDRERIAAAGIALSPCEYRTAPYHQQYDGFLPGLSVLDLLFNEGPAAASIIKRNSWIRG